MLEKQSEAMEECLQIGSSLEELRTDLDTLAQGRDKLKVEEESQTHSKLAETLEL